MYWDTTKYGHTTRIQEHNHCELTLVCLTCDPKRTAPLHFTREEYPKYRVAYYAAVTAANQHMRSFANPLDNTLPV